MSNQSGTGHLITGPTQFLLEIILTFGPNGSKAILTVDRLIVGGKEVILVKMVVVVLELVQVVIHQKLQAMQINLLGTYGVTY